MKPTVLLYRLPVRQIVLPNGLIWTRVYSGGIRFESRPVRRLYWLRSRFTASFHILSSSSPINHPNKLYCICCVNKPTSAPVSVANRNVVPQPCVGLGLLHCFVNGKFCGVRSAPCPTPSLEDQWLPLLFDLCGSTRNLRFRQHSSPDHWGAHTTSLGGSPGWGIRKFKYCDNDARKPE
jgi:hypothetical protein